MKYLDRLVRWYCRWRDLRHLRWMRKNRVLITAKPERGTVIGNWGRL